MHLNGHILPKSGENVFLAHSKVIQRNRPSNRCIRAQKEASWLEQNADIARAAPLVAGASGIAGVLVNRIVSGVAPVVSASSSQSRADVLLIVMSAILALTGLHWLSLKPKAPLKVDLIGSKASYIETDLSLAVNNELLWAWNALTSSTSAEVMVVVHNDRCIMHYGLAANDATVGQATAGPMCKEAMAKTSGKYLGNVQLFPGRTEILKYLPENTQSAIIQPFGSQGVLIVAGPYQRGFSRLDQAWIATVCDKLEVLFDDAA